MFVELSVHSAGDGKRRAVLVNANDVTDVELVAAGTVIRFANGRRLVVDEPLEVIWQRFGDAGVLPGAQPPVRRDRSGQRF
jgi:hypothetical protein